MVIRPEDSRFMIWQEVFCRIGLSGMVIDKVAEASLPQAYARIR